MYHETSSASGNPSRATWSIFMFMSVLASKIAFNFVSRLAVLTNVDPSPPSTSLREVLTPLKMTSSDDSLLVCKRFCPASIAHS
jgi:hypothetical protein